MRICIRWNERINGDPYTIIMARYIEDRQQSYIFQKTYMNVDCYQSTFYPLYYYQVINPTASLSVCFHMCHFPGTLWPGYQSGSFFLCIIWCMLFSHYFMTRLSIHQLSQLYILLNAFPITLWSGYQSSSFPSYTFYWMHFPLLYDQVISLAAFPVIHFTECISHNFMIRLSI